MRFTITRVYMVDAPSEAEALEQLQAAVADGTDLDHQEVEFIRVVPSDTDGGWMKAITAQL